MSETATAHEDFSITGYLTRDHHAIHARVDEVEKLAGAGQAELADRALADLEAGLACHIRVEEEELFPLFVQRCPGGARPVAVMLGEHRAIAQALAVLRGALGRGAPERVAAACVELRALLALHDQKEERILYPAIDRAIDETERLALVQHLMLEVPATGRQP